MNNPFCDDYFCKVSKKACLLIQAKRLNHKLSLPKYDILFVKPYLIQAFARPI